MDCSIRERTWAIWDESAQKRIGEAEALETRCSNYTRPHSFSGYRWKNIVSWQRGLTLCLRMSWLIFGLSHNRDWKRGEKRQQTMGRLTRLFLIQCCILGISDWLGSLLQAFTMKIFLSIFLFEWFGLLDLFLCKITPCMIDWPSRTLHLWRLVFLSCLKISMRNKKQKTLSKTTLAYCPLNKLRRLPSQPFTHLCISPSTLRGTRR